mmetsp:Transcript_5144/g.10154  ORF Transcript_5144/g.10154 Transcript_5144/m.10154 type:complete len:235 (+) Transcript_5144:450-1154(+)
MRHNVSKRTTHGQSRDIHVPQPDTGRSVDAIIVFDGKDTTTAGQDTFLFLRRVGLVVKGDILEGQTAVLFLTQDDARISHVDTIDSVTTHNGHRQRGSTKLGVNAVVAQQITFALSNGIGTSFLQVGRPGGVVEEFRDQLITEGLRNTVSVFTVSIQHAQDDGVGVGIVGHNQSILILLPRIVGSMSLFRNTRILRDSATDLFRGFLDVLAVVFFRLGLSPINVFLVAGTARHG